MLLSDYGGWPLSAQPCIATGSRRVHRVFTDSDSLATPVFFLEMLEMFAEPRSQYDRVRPC